MHAVAANGARIPTIEFGTYGMTRPDMLRMIPAALLRWLIQQGDVVALSRTTNPERIVENLAVFDFELREDEMAAIQTLARPNSRIVNPAGLAPVWDAS